MLKQKKIYKHKVQKVNLLRVLSLTILSKSLTKIKI